MTIQTGAGEAIPLTYESLAEINVQNNTAVFTGGRFNAPTPGHMRLIEQTCSIANNAFPVHVQGAVPDQADTDTVFVLLTKTDYMSKNQEPEKYPLTCDYKITIVNEMIQNRMKTIIEATTDTSTKDKLSNMKIIVICVQALLAYKQVVNHINKLTHINNPTPAAVQDTTKSLKINKVIFCLGEEEGNQKVENMIQGYRPLNVENVVLHQINRGETSMTKYSTYNCHELNEAFNDEHTRSETFNPITMSGTLVRNIVNCGHFPTVSHKDTFFEMFRYIYSEYLSDKTISELYSKINAGLMVAYDKKPSNRIQTKRKSEGTGTDNSTNVKNGKTGKKPGGRKTKRKRTKKTKRRNSKKYRGIYF